MFVAVTDRSSELKKGCVSVCVPGTRARDRPVRNVPEGPGMDRTISEQLNKAFEAYRNASIEKDLARKELQHKVPFVNYRFHQKRFI